MTATRSWLPVLVLLGAVPAVAGGYWQAGESVARDPAVYRQVTHVGWVVRDLDAVVGHWRRLGLHVAGEPRELERRTVIYRGRPTTVRARTAMARVGDVTLEWIQPLGDGPNAYTAFLAARGDGIHHLAYTVPSEARLEAEVASFAARGVGVVQRGSWQGERGTALSAYLDTAPAGGGLTIALRYDPDPPRTAGWPPNGDPFNQITQYAFLVRNVKAVGAFYERLGFGPMPVDHNVSLNRRYRGQPGVFEMYLGWGRGGSVTFEWIEPLVGPSVYDEFLQAKGEGFHHLGFHVPDIDAAVARLEAAGLQVTMSGGWDSNGHRGRFAYLDAEKVGGVSIELLWNEPRTE